MAQENGVVCRPVCLCKGSTVESYEKHIFKAMLRQVKSVIE